MTLEYLGVSPMPANFTFGADARWAADERSGGVSNIKISAQLAVVVAANCAPGLSPASRASHRAARQTAILARIGITLSFHGGSFGVTLTGVPFESHRQGGWFRR